MKICKRCIYNDTIPGISFDNDGICNYCHIHDEFEKSYPISEEIMDKLVKRIKKKGKNKKYDCVVGISGGCDSSYLLYKVVDLGLRPLAVHLDTGWNTKIAEYNMELVCSSLNVDRKNYSVDNEEYNDLYRSFIKASVPDLEATTDIALTTSLYKAAEEFNVKYILNGHSFRTEGIAPIGVAYMDGKYISDIHQKFGEIPMKTFPNLWMHSWLKWMILLRIKRVRPLYYMNYNKEEAKKLLFERFGWKWYGGHHSESIFTHFFINYFRYKIMGIDSRIIELSALIRSGQKNREDALKEVESDPFISDEIIETVCNKLNLDVKNISPPIFTYKNFNTYKHVFVKYKMFFWILYKFGLIPKTFYVKYTSRG